MASPPNNLKMGDKEDLAARCKKATIFVGEKMISAGEIKKGDEAASEAAVAGGVATVVGGVAAVEDEADGRPTGPISVSFGNKLGKLCDDARLKVENIEEPALPKRRSGGGGRRAPLLFLFLGLLLLLLASGTLAYGFKNQELVLQFSEDTNSTFFLKVLIEEPFCFRDDVATGVRYRNLFDVMADPNPVMFALHENIPVIVREMGWPSSGEGNRFKADGGYTAAIGLKEHLKSGLGRPLWKAETKHGSDSISGLVPKLLIEPPFLEFLDTSATFLMVGNHLVMFSWRREDLSAGVRVRYRKLMAIMDDSAISWIMVPGHEDIPVIVMETSWLSSGEGNEIDTGHHLKSGLGMPKFGGVGTHHTGERYWGIYPNKMMLGQGRRSITLVHQEVWFL